MVPIKPTKTVYTVANFLDWQRNGALQLKPTFQRREVWSPKAKSLFIDSLAKGLPIPIVFLRSVQDLKKLSSSYEVVDGQQRLRTLFSYIDPKVLDDYDAAKDDFKVLKIHNKELADTEFSRLPKEIQSQLLSFELSTHVLPADTADEVVLRIFARMNSTGSKLNHQEIRNSQFFGQFKTLSYDLALDTLAYWRKWGVFDDNDFARMQEVETTSDLLIALMEGVSGKSQAKLDATYQKYDDKLLGADALAQRFERVVAAIDAALGDELERSELSRVALFYSFFVAVYDHMYGLGSALTAKAKPKILPKDLLQKVRLLDKMIRGGKLPAAIEDAVVKATTDKGRRDTRHAFLMGKLALASAG